MGSVERRAARPLPPVHRRQAPHPLPGPGRGDPRAARRQERHPEHADRLRQVARRVRDALRLARARAAGRLHLPDQGARQREVDGAVPRVRPGSGRPLDRRRDGQPRRADPLLHGRGPRQHRAARRRRRRLQRRGDGRVPLLRRPRPRRRLAGAAADDAAGAIPADVGNARRHAVLRGGHHAPQRARDGDGEVRRSPRAARVRLLRDPAGAHDREARGRGQDAGLRRPLHAGRRGRAARRISPASRSAPGNRRPRSPRASPTSHSAARTAPTSASGSGTASACTTRDCSRSTACWSSSSRRRDC